MAIRAPFVLVVSLGLSGTIVRAQEATFELSGVPAGRTGAEPRGIAADRGTVLLTARDANGSRHPYLWSRSGIAPVPGTPTEGRFAYFGMSADGGTLFGERGGAATYWRGSVPTTLPAASGIARSRITSASSDGTAFVVEGETTAGRRSVLRWSAAAGYLDLVPETDATMLTPTITGDGTRVYGTAVHLRSGTSGAAYWTADGGSYMLSKPTAFETPKYGARAVSADGATVLGYASRRAEIHTVLWVRGEFHDLGNVPGGTGDVLPVTLSSDGRIAAGTYAPGSAGFGGDRRPFLWDLILGMRDLRDALVRAGLGNRLEGIAIVSVAAVERLPSGATLVVGTARDRAGVDQAFRATIPETARFSGIGDLDGGRFDSTAIGISADGARILGNGYTPFARSSFVWSRGYGPRWEESSATPASEFRIVSPNGGFTTAMAANAGAMVGFYVDGGYHRRENGESRTFPSGTRAEGVSGDGTVAVGSALGPDGIRHTYRWKGAGTERYLTYVGGHVAPSHAVAASNDGAVFVGTADAHTSGGTAYDARAFLWTSSGGQRALGDLPGGRVESEALAVSADGATVVGWSHSANGPEAFRWTAAGGMIGLGDLPGSGFASRALAVSPDGGVVVGFGVSGGKNRAFVWDAKNGMRDLQTVLERAGATGLAGWTLSAATGVTRDAEGRIFVCGSGTDEQGRRQAFHASLPSLAASTLP